MCVCLHTLEIPPIYICGIFGVLSLQHLPCPHKTQEELFQLVCLQLPRVNIVTSFSLILGVLWPWFWTTAEFLCGNQVNVLQSGTCSRAVDSRKDFHSFIYFLNTCLLIIDMPCTSFNLRFFWPHIASVPKAWKMFSQRLIKSTALREPLEWFNWPLFLWNLHIHSCMSTVKSWVSCSDYLVIEIINLVKIPCYLTRIPVFLVHSAFQ